MQQELESRVSDFFISRVLAHSIVFETREFYSPGGIVSDARNNDDKAPKSTEESTAAMLEAVTANLPGLANVVRQDMLPMEQQKLAVARQISPKYYALLTELYSKYAPQLAKTGANLEDVSRKAGIKTDLELLGGSGGQLVNRTAALDRQLTREQQNLDRQLNPEYYQARSVLNNNIVSQIQDLAGSVNAPNIEAERLINQENIRSGNLGTPSQTNTIANALSFGNERLKRQEALSKILALGSANLPQMVGRFGMNKPDVLQVALGRPSNNSGISMFNGVQTPGGDSLNLASNLLGQAGNYENTRANLDARRRDTMDRVSQGMGTVGNIIWGSAGRT